MKIDLKLCFSACLASQELTFDCKSLTVGKRNKAQKTPEEVLPCAWRGVRCSHPSGDPAWGGYKEDGESLAARSPAGEMSDEYKSLLGTLQLDTRGNLFLSENNQSAVGIHPQVRGGYPNVGHSRLSWAGFRAACRDHGFARKGCSR